MKKVEYLAFPRLSALAEVAWTPVALKNYDDFSSRLTGVMKHYDGGKLNYAKPVPAPKRETKDGSVIQTSLDLYEGHFIESAFDGRQDTFFWANRALKTDDDVTLKLKSPLVAATPVEVITGGPASQNGDKLESGVLETSNDGSTWTKLADFKDGKASGTAAAGTKQVRVRVTAPQEFWLIIHEISVGGK
jgi:hexosaminidase